MSYIKPIPIFTLDSNLKSAIKIPPDVNIHHPLNTHVGGILIALWVEKQRLVKLLI